jgi:hypothetical protein
MVFKMLIKSTMNRHSMSNNLHKVQILSLHFYFFLSDNQPFDLKTAQIAMECP